MPACMSQAIVTDRRKRCKGKMIKVNLVNALQSSTWKGVLGTCAEAYRSGLSMIISEVAIRGAAKNILTKCSLCLVMPIMGMGQS